MKEAKSVGEIHVRPDAIKGVEASSVRRSIELFFRFADIVGPMTPTPIDDQVFAVMRQFALEDWFVDLVARLMGASAARKTELVASLAEPGMVGVVSPETIRGIIESVLKFAEYVVPLTGTDADDQVLSVIKKFATEAWFLDLLSKLFGLAHENRPKFAATIA